MSNEGALATLDDDAAIERLAAGTLSKVIAAEYGVTPFGLRKRLAKHPDYKQAIDDQAESFVEDALHEVWECPNEPVAIARARTKFDCSIKWAAARNPAKWGNRATLDVTVDLGSALQAMAERLQGRIIEHQHDAAQQLTDIQDGEQSADAK